MNRSAHTPQMQRGAATLVVVMVLFIVMALLAAYANRSLMFEQRIAGSYARASLSQELAEASVEWSVAMLNGGAVDADCKPADAPTGKRFVDRYFNVNIADRGTIPVSSAGYQADCTRTGEGWTCRCPAAGTRTRPAAISGEGLVPSFGVAFTTLSTYRAGTVRLDATGCTDSVVDNCRDRLDNSRNLQGVSRPRALLALAGAVRTPPAAPLVAKNGLTVVGGGLGLHNTDPQTAGLLYTLGGVATGLSDTRLDSVPGTPPALARIDSDATLSGADVFRMFMGMAASRYVNHPALHVVTCSEDCAVDLLAAYTAGRRMLWVNGAMNLSSDVTLGSDTDPLLVVATGNVTLTGPFQLTGLLVSRGNLTWTNTAAMPSLVTGAVLVEGDMQTTGTMDIHYRQAVANQLRNRLGSYVRVSGGWSDVTD